MPCLRRFALGLLSVLGRASEQSCKAGDGPGCQGGPSPGADGEGQEPDDFARDGFRVLRGVLSASQVSRARQALQSGKVHHNFDPTFFSDRIPDILSLDPVFGEILEEGIPAALEEQMKQTLGPWHVGSFHALVIHPHAAKEHIPEDMVGLHTDYPYGHATEMWGGGLRSIPPQYPPTMQILWMLDEFTEQNGATRVLPGSHRDQPMPNPMNQTDKSKFMAGAKVITGSPGDMLVYMGRGLWHAWAVNRAQSPRAALLCQCLPFFVKPMENHAWVLPTAIARAFSTKLRSRLGIFPDAFLLHSTLLVRSQRSLATSAQFLADALWAGYSDPQQDGRKAAVAALAVPLALWIVSAGRCLRLREVVGYTVALAAGLALGATVTLERLRM
mmetsp:Transcript_63626/g.201113  ORF Transcript_63626/g.201113 Transcript_63626/m.201113 type:complete len:387 (-) Transcript_63626:22-1182(-)